MTFNGLNNIQDTSPFQKDGFMKSTIAKILIVLSIQNSVENICERNLANKERHI